MAGELHRPIRLGCVHTSTKRQSESPVPEDLGVLGRSAPDATSRATPRVTKRVALRRLCVSGAAGAADGFGETVLLTERQHQLSGALQHPATGKQSDQVSILSSKQKD